MTQITYILHNGQKITIDGRDTLSVMENGVRNAIPGIVAECGGSCMCATCHVYIEDDAGGVIGSRSEAEEAMLEEAIDEVKQNSRLSCQIKVSPTMNGLVVRIAQNE
jgi:ferredoxin, 2Fe-2S